MQQVTSATTLCEFLNWDSEFFGRRIGRATEHRLSATSVAAMLEWCVDNAIDCLYFLAEADDEATARLAEDHGFRLVDVRVALEASLAGMRTGDDQNDVTRGLEIRQSRSGDIASLQEIARHSYLHSRFYFDRRFPRELCDAFYATWIKNSCEGYADAVLVAEMDGKQLGYVSCHLDNDSEGHIGLVGVSSQAQGYGIGQLLVKHALSWFAENNVATVSVVTQGRNVAAQRLYQRCGFLTKSVQLWYHKWMREMP